MKLTDRQFRKHIFKYIVQCTLATAAVYVILLILDARSNAAIIGALGASSFIAFTMPKKHVSEARFMVGGYAVGVGAGALCHFLATWTQLSTVPFAAAAVGLAIFAMVVTDTEHPPAAGVALGLVLNGCTYTRVSVVMVGILALYLIKRLLRPVLIDLL